MSLRERNGGLRILRAEIIQQGRQHIGAEKHGTADVERDRALRAKRSEVLFHFPFERVDLFDLFDIVLTGFRQRDGAR